MDHTLRDTDVYSSTDWWSAFGSAIDNPLTSETLPIGLHQFIATQPATDHPPVPRPRQLPF